MLAFARARASVEEAERLGLERGERVLHIRNRLSVSGWPVVLDDIALPARHMPDLDERAFTGREGTIYGLYQARYGINVIRIAERLSACLADAESAQLLGLAEGAPLLRIARVAYTYHDQPVELRLSLVNTARHEYFSDLVKT